MLRKMELLVHTTTYDLPGMHGLLRACIVGHGVKALNGTHSEYLLVTQSQTDSICASRHARDPCD